MIVHDRFPWESHLTLAEVDERNDLRLVRKRLGSDFRYRHESRATRLAALEARSVIVPPEPEPPAAA